MAVVVKNLPADADTRLRKQLRDLLSHGYGVSVITQAGEENQPYREVRNLTHLECPPPVEPGGPIGHVREYLMSFLWAALLLGRLRRRGPIDILRVCQPPDVYFHCARPCAGRAPGSWSTSATGCRSCSPPAIRTRHAR